MGAVDVYDLVLGQTSSPFSKPRKPLHSRKRSIHQLGISAIFVSVFSYLSVFIIVQRIEMLLTSGWIDTLFTLARLLQLRKVSVAFQVGPAEKVPEDNVHLELESR